MKIHSNSRALVFGLNSSPERNGVVVYVEQKVNSDLYPAGPIWLCSGMLNGVYENWIVPEENLALLDDSDDLVIEFYTEKD